MNKNTINQNHNNNQTLIKIIKEATHHNHSLNLPINNNLQTHIVKIKTHLPHSQKKKPLFFSTI